MNSINIVPQLPSPYPSLSGSVEKSFAWDTLAKRVPVILTKIVNDLYIRSVDPKRSQTAKSLMEQLGQLRHQLTRSTALKPLQDDGSDVPVWNALLEQWWNGEGKWFTVSWLFAECYLYRRVHEMIQLSDWREYDPFETQKQSSFTTSWPSMKELSKRVYDLSQLVQDANDTSAVGIKEAFSELLEYALWGNQADLSLLVSMSHSDIKDLHSTSSSQLQKLQEKLLVNDSEKIWNIFEKMEGGRVDIVLDNAGFELFNDLCLAHFLIKGGFASKVVFHVKNFPWFVSDVTRQDFTWTLNQLAEQTELEECQQLKDFANEWSLWLGQGTWEIRENSFWTTPYSFWYLPTAAPELFQDLFGSESKSSVTCFKGDLNYRKLVNDLDWPPTSTFSQGLGPLTYSIKRPLIALRTCKADTCVGLSSEMLSKVQGEDKDWMVNGKWGMIALQEPMN